MPFIILSTIINYLYKLIKKKEHGLITKTHFQLNILDLPCEGILADYTETGRKVIYFNIAPESPELLLKHPAFFGFTLERPFHLSVDHDDLSHCTGEFQNKNGERLIARVYVDALDHVNQVSLKHYATHNTVEGTHILIDADLKERIIQCAKPGTNLFHHLVEKKWATVLSLETDLKQLDKDVASLWQDIETLSHEALNDSALEIQTAKNSS